MLHSADTQCPDTRDAKGASLSKSVLQSLQMTSLYKVIVEAVSPGCVDFPVWPESSHFFEWSTYKVSLFL